MVDIKSRNLQEIEQYLLENGYVRFRAKQIYDWLKKGVTSFDEMKNLPRELINFLKENCYIYVTNIEKKLISGYDNTVKYLFVLHDESRIEAVVMNYKHGNTICISTQAGCKMNCDFCATGKIGFNRNLFPSEMLSQIETAEKDLNIKISNVVLMGMGEPLDNFENVIKFLQLVNEKIGMRHISLSTCGIVPKIYELAKYKFGLTLSVSLHAPNNFLRSRTMPINKKYPIEQLLKACKDYADATSRRISFEYALISGVNDSDENAIELAGKLKGILCHVNLIPVNETEKSNYRKSSKERIKSFINILEKSRINVTVRRSLGQDINAACGQLAAKNI